MKNHLIGMNIKQNMKIEMQQMSIDIFSNQTLQELADCLFWFIQMKITIQKSIKSSSIIYQKILLRIIMSS